MYIHKLLTVQKSQKLILWTLNWKVTAMCTLETMLASIPKGRICHISYTCSKSWKSISAFDTDKLFYSFFGNGMLSLLSKKYKSFTKNVKLLLKLKNYICLMFWIIFFPWYFLLTILVFSCLRSKELVTAGM